MMLVAEQETDRAMGLFQRAQALRPEHSWAYAGLGMALNAKGYGVVGGMKSGYVVLPRCRLATCPLPGNLTKT